MEEAAPPPPEEESDEDYEPLYAQKSVKSKFSQVSELFLFLSSFITNSLGCLTARQRPPHNSFV